MKAGDVEVIWNLHIMLTSDGDSPMANLRRKNGRDKAWKVKFLGVGNESWGCGGNMEPAYYADLFRRYSTYCRNYDNNQLFKIASGASDYDYNWTETLMKKNASKMNGLSLHYYTVKGWNGSKGSATKFSTDDYYWTLGKCLEIEDVVKKHMAIMDKYDPKKKVGLMVDEWGTWWDVEPGTNPGHLFQQNTLRDAFVAALTLNVFNKYGDRIQMANIAQVVNVLQSMILTKGKQIVLTPTYYVFDMYKVHQGATYLPLTLTCDTMKLANNRAVPALSVSASKDIKGLIHITMANTDLNNSEEVDINIPALKTNKVTGSILTAKEVDDYNAFDAPEKVMPKEFKDAKITKQGLKVKMPAKSIVVLELN